jgi:hypothetical protein
MMKCYSINIVCVGCEFLANRSPSPKYPIVSAEFGGADQLRLP